MPSPALTLTPVNWGAIQRRRQLLPQQVKSLRRRDRHPMPTAVIAQAVTGRAPNARVLDSNTYNINGFWIDLTFYSFCDYCHSSSADEDDPPEIKVEREKERRQANNARERYVWLLIFDFVLVNQQMMKIFPRLTWARYNSMEIYLIFSLISILLMSWLLILRTNFEKTLIDLQNPSPRYQRSVQRIGSNGCHSPEVWQGDYNRLFNNLIIL